MADPTVLEIGECPYHVVYRDIGAASQGVNAAHGGDFGTFTDLDVDWYEPGHLAGDLLLFVLISSKGTESLPAGYTAVDAQTWDNAPITPPIHGANSTTEGPAYRENVLQLIGYRIATTSGGSDAVPAGQYSGYTYTDGGLGYPNDFAGVRVYRFSVEHLGGDYEITNNWGVNPVKAGTFLSQDYKIQLGPGGGAFGSSYPADEGPGPNIVSVADTMADYDGNHIYMSIVGVHGPILADVTSYPTSEQENSMALTPRQKKTTGSPGLDTYGINQASTGPGGDLKNAHYAIAYLSSTNYFNSFRPASIAADLGLVENGFIDSTCDPGREVTAHMGDNWQDGFIGVAGTDFYIWDLIGGVSTIQLVIQGPETTRPFNDNIADAYNNTVCPVALIECAFGQTAEGDELWDGLGDPDRNAGVWFKWTPSTSQTVDINTSLELPDPLPGETGTPYTDYDTLLYVYTGTPGSLTVVDSDDDSGGGAGTSELTVTVTGGVTYYIQVAGYAGGEGRFVLFIDCEELAAYWGILVTALPP